ncbi:hypothetical protein [Calidithermus chliarophilus]|uniref:hypothetical protein n=1 Tax=Calidithermus chliarophilus TaxID=52023 RepID=UPI0004068D72|nr:hypothetical protein [Calidithermus chliarophilus]
MKAVIDTVQKILAVVVAAVNVVELVSEATGEKGAQKKAEAKRIIKELLPAEALPLLMRPFYDPILDFLIDAVVSYCNAKGIFAKGEGAGAAKAELPDLKSLSVQDVLEARRK